MVYESDFYTTRRYRTSPSVSSYTTSTVPSRQVRILPGLGKVHIVHSYDRIVPYVGHKRLTVVTVPPKVYSTRPSVLQREFDWIENRVRPWVGYSATNRYLNSDSAVRISYVPYPITGVNYYSTYYRPSISYYPKIYRWYYDWPRDSYYLPYYRYLSTYLNYASPISRSLQDSFSKIEYDIDNFRKMIYCSTPISGIDYIYYPETTKYYRPLTLHYNYYYPLRTLNYYSHYWPTYSYWPTYRYYKYLSWPSDRYWFLQRIFDDETRLIRAQSQSLLKRIHTPVPRLQKFFPITTYRYEDALPVRVSNDNYIHRMLTSSPSKAEYTTYWTEPVRKYIGQGHLSCVSYAGDRAYNRRRNVWMYEDPMRNDIQLLSYYIQKFRSEKAQEPKIKEVALSPARPSRKFTANKAIQDTTAQELRQMKEERAARLAKIYAEESSSKSSSTDVDDAVKAKKKQEEARALAEEQARLAAQAKKEEAARKAELARQEELAAQAAAERVAELEKQAELARQEELAKQAAIEKAKKDEEERLRLEEQKRLEEEARAEEERQALIRLEELARQAEEEKEAELVRQAEELAELARQEQELAEEAKKEEELAELARQQAELEDLARQEAELEELERREQYLMEQARQEAEAASKARIEADAAILEAKLAALAQQEQEAELAELDRQQAELDAAEEQAQEEEEVPQEEETVEPEQEPEAVQEEEDIIEDEEEPHAIAEDVPEAQASDVEDAVEEEEAQEE